MNKILKEKDELDKLKSYLKVESERVMKRAYMKRIYIKITKMKRE